MFFVSSGVTKTMAEDVEGFESCVEDRRIGSTFYVEKGAKTVIPPLFNCIDVMAVLPTGFRKKVNFSDVCHEKSMNRILECHRDFSISSIIRDQVSG